jgi:ribosomal protein L37AE/L43A
MPRTATAAAALCLACHGPLESERRTVLDRYVVELWWCRDCNAWWGSGSSQDDVNDRAVFCRTHPVALAARMNRLASIEPVPVRRRP